MQCNIKSTEYMSLHICFIPTEQPVECYADGFFTLYLASVRFWEGNPNYGNTWVLSEKFVIEVLLVLRQEPYIVQKPAFLATVLLEETQDVL